MPQKGWTLSWTGVPPMLVDLQAVMLKGQAVKEAPLSMRVAYVTLRWLVKQGTHYVRHVGCQDGYGGPKKLPLIPPYMGTQDEQPPGLIRVDTGLHPGSIQVVLLVPLKNDRKRHLFTKAVAGVLQAQTGPTPATNILYYMFAAEESFALGPGHGFLDLHLSLLC